MKLLVAGCLALLDRVVGHLCIFVSLFVFYIVLIGLVNILDAYTDSSGLIVAICKQLTIVDSLLWRQLGRWAAESIQSALQSHQPAQQFQPTQQSQPCGRHCTATPVDWQPRYHYTV
jgi:hypothetical protein